MIMAALGLIGLTDPNIHIGAADNGAAAPSAVAATPTPTPAAPERARLGDIPPRAEETSRIIEERNQTKESRKVRGLHHGRDFETPSTLVDRGPGAVSVNPEERFESDLGGIPLLPEAELGEHPHEGYAPGKP